MYNCEQAPVFLKQRFNSMVKHTLYNEMINTRLILERDDYKHYTCTAHIHVRTRHKVIGSSDHMFQHVIDEEKNGMFVKSCHIRSILTFSQIPIENTGCL